MNDEKRDSGELFARHVAYHCSACRRVRDAGGAAEYRGGSAPVCGAGR